MNLLRVATTSSMDGDENGDVAAYLRGKAFIAGVREDTPIEAACDVFMALEVEGVPKEQMDKWRKRMDRQTVRVREIDRATWGQTPAQMAQMSKLMGSAGP